MEMRRIFHPRGPGWTDAVGNRARSFIMDGEAVVAGADGVAGFRRATGAAAWS
jgi:hypothetical protein